MARKPFTLEASVDCRGVYTVMAETEEEARDIFEQWDGGDSVTFNHYSEELPGEILSVRED